MPTRRIFELIVVTSILIRPAFGLVHLWAHKALQSQPQGTITHGVAEIVTVII